MNVEGMSREALLAELLKTKLFLEQIIEYSPNSMWISDEHGTLILLNQACRNFMKVADDEVVGKYNVFSDNVIEEQGFMPLVRDVFEKGIITRFTTQYDTAALNNIEPEQTVQLYLDVHISPIIDIDGKVTNAIVQHSDITERILIEKALFKAKENAEESDRLKSAFLANMSHEIRTPMNGILGFSDLLSEQGLTLEEQQTYAGIIKKSGIRLLNIIKDLVDIAKIEAGQMEVSYVTTNLNEKIGDVYNLFKPEADKNGLKMTYLCGLPPEEAIIRTDGNKIVAILSNLVNNSIKFTTEGFVEFGYRKSGGFLEFYVKDSGEGIRYDQHDLIFQRFMQGESRIAKNPEGTGLGLSISKAFVEMLGGKIWLKSDLGKGATFFFTIPFSAGGIENLSGNGTEKLISTKNRPYKLKILIAEDDESSEILVEELVKDFSSKILYAKTGAEAVELYRNNPDIDLILMDIRLPETDGCLATYQIRQMNKDVVIIAETAFAMRGDREKALAAGCTDYITKPISKNLFIEMIDSYFGYGKGRM
jgi:PAS domain S-box-containing protein